MSTVEQIAEQLNKLTLLEAAQLSKLLQETWGVSAAAPMAVAAVPGAAGAAAGGAAATEEKTEFDVILTAAGEKKIQVRSEERRVGKEWRAGWWTERCKQQQKRRDEERSNT